MNVKKLSKIRIISRDAKHTCKLKTNAIIKLTTLYYNFLFKVGSFQSSLCDLKRTDFLLYFNYVWGIEFFVVKLILQHLARNHHPFVKKNPIVIQ